MQICLRPEGLALGPGGIPARILSERRIGARRTVTLSPDAAPDLRLRPDLERDHRPGPDCGLMLRGSAG